MFGNFFSGLFFTAVGFSVMIPFASLYDNLITAWVAVFNLTTFETAFINLFKLLPIALVVFGVWQIVKGVRKVFEPHD